MDNKYVMSVIRLPLHIHEDGTYTSLHDFIHMGFEPCATLPAIQDQSICMKQLDELIRTLHPPMLSKEENTIVGQADVEAATTEAATTEAATTEAATTEAAKEAAKEAVTHTIPPPIPWPIPPPIAWPIPWPVVHHSRDRNSRTTTFKNYAALAMQKQNKYSRKNLVT
jgi:hypothetical protein